MPPNTEIKCSQTVKNTAHYTVEPCAAIIPKGALVCPNTEYHISPLKTGLCNAGFCEGMNKEDFRGNKVRSCARWQTCPCVCHTVFDQMFEMSGQPRILIDNSGYVTPERSFWMPTPEERAAMRAASSSNDPATAPVRIEGADPDRVPATLARPYAPTATGRSARGELESMVKAICDVWVVDQPADRCSPPYIASQIGRTYGIKEPSLGAVDAVLKRWVKLDFAVVDSKPTRFTRYTEEGIMHTLDGLKERARLASKS